VQRVVVQLLEDSGYRVVTASDGGEAVVRVRELGDRIALALLDVVMPVMSGPEVAAQIRERHPAIRVLFTSGYSDDAVTGAVDASAILRKPYEPTRLLRRIRDELDGGAGESRG
jgi:CheY-like chemotaxis protein